MKLILTGEIDGQIIDFYRSVETTPDWILSTGSFGTWPDPRVIDRGTRNSVGPGDFAKLYINGWQAPLQTLYVSGVHEDHRWLNKAFKSRQMEVLPSVHWLSNGYRTTIGDFDKSVRVTGFGKVYSESTFNGNLNNRSHRHYTRKEFEKACSSGPTDILLLHEKPGNIITRKIIFATQPKMIVFSSKEKEVEKFKIMNVEAIGLPKMTTFFCNV